MARGRHFGVPRPLQEAAMSTAPADGGDDARRDEDPGLIDDTAPLPPEGGEQTVPSEGPDDPPNEGQLPRDPD
ncbi:hypothetical protein GCM10011354_19930 [Egicoccus halophilus]|uniref:Uncharacterized protein n=2 Tax=Egicoccus halophilus TaxID=1670830 RepID=A0A8J3AE28_9ACTN|nr:hypothetical protein GCM10011354_19930 [Egicoccus halophilus]